MKKQNIQRSVMALMALMSSTTAMADNALVSSFENAQVVGYIRACYYADINEAPWKNDSILGGVGGSVGIETAPLEHFSVRGQVYTSQPIGYNAERDASSEGMAGSNGKGFTVLGQGYLKYQTDDLRVLVGRQEVSTPMINEDWSKIVPNLYNGYMLYYTGWENTVATAGYLTQMMGPPDSYAPVQQFASMTVAGTQNKEAQEIVGNHGIAMAGIKNESIKGLSAEAWYLFSNTFADIYETNVKYDDTIATLPYRVSAQYYYMESRSDVDEKYGSKFVEYDFYGADAEIDWQPMFFSVGFDQVTKRSTTSQTYIQSWGSFHGDAQADHWSLQDMQNNNLFSKNVTASQALLGLNVFSSVVKLYYTYYDSDQVNSDVQAIDLLVVWTPKEIEGLQINAVYEIDQQDGTYQSATGPVDVDQHYFRMKATYLF